MKIAALIARILLGLVFVVFGLNAFLQFMPGTLPPGPAGQFAGIMMQSHYMHAVAVFQIAGGALLLIGRYIPLGLALLGPVIVNILFFHLFLFRTGIEMGVIAAALWTVVFIRYRQYFSGIFVQRAS
jgi:uncharacterized membrane protein YphA (DoxX/SURF4 family)